MDLKYIELKIAPNNASERAFKIQSELILSVHVAGVADVDEA